MIRIFRWLIIVCFFFLKITISAQNVKPLLVSANTIINGDQQTGVYFPLIKGKKVGVVANQSSIINKIHLVDTMIYSGIKVVHIFSPEHGFRGNADAGQVVKNGMDSKTGIPVISLYGKHKKPSAFDLSGIDVMVFDLQDVGVRFYTYISTLTLVMEACAENHIPLILLDRPNPNGFYVDGPVLKKGFESFVGMHNVPVVYGMTIGEYAKMVNGEKWLKNGISCRLKVVKLKKYTHNMIVKLAVKPSPNLPDWQSIYLYPSLCFFEGTVVSVGRGTALPFQVFGYPGMKGNYSFIPHSIPGAALHPKLENKVCRGFNLRPYAEHYRKNPSQIHLKWLIYAYRQIHKSQSNFFNGYFNTLAGNDLLKSQITDGIGEKAIRKSWQPGLKHFKSIRSKYLLYK